ncbi:MAG TPA: short chain dehydrogenase [Chloroflexus aurantiacus]|jgi:short-subunit dehydrogenase|uniref:Short-chain dehydrogenase/reductase SDR n=1 Tax=Chloroflexus aurantiacus (strain ATCC 29366 / DSM 635 / J-10-fl) TaxID=324602 RepID=A9WDL4_CHLAA|nr:SDR family oxidoreductase [Chloroflexus aurantiacus]ABY33620.1 short-chain dehydrogenase/reductase SDR [Chloroflexus aurantiacus J-10-fl]RMG52578.1 MAG: SDR family oxidoreductase [Chloroflexota bacterium]GIV95270.1 MAG: short-chain dehydrogenase [Chloroflexus sp.]HBW67770.1 short chain dehydrogenase [Chloroflexus aurantiacus]
MDPRDRVVIITGASSGIGAATARCFAAAGARLVLAARSQEALTQVAADLPQALAVPTDVSDPEACMRLVERAVATYGQVDILINNAGIGLTGPVTRLARADLERVLAVDLLGPIWLTQAVVPIMRAGGRGQIINVSSVLAVQPLPFLGGYAAAKAALEQISNALRIELHGSGIAVTVVRPGTTRTDFNQRRLGRGRERRRIAPPGVPPEVVARTILRAARTEPRLAYVSWSDRLALWIGRLFPGLIDAILARAFVWEEQAYH